MAGKIPKKSGQTTVDNQEAKPSKGTAKGAAAAFGKKKGQMSPETRKKVAKKLKDKLNGSK